jgi:hypothetical protein
MARNKPVYRRTIACWLLQSVFATLGSFHASAQSPIAEQADRMWQMRQQTRQQIFDSISGPTFESTEQVEGAEFWESTQPTLLQDERLFDEAPVERFKRGFFQRAGLNGGWLGSDTELEISSWEASVSVAVPLGSFENLLIITPQFRVDYLAGPEIPDAPSQLYETGATLFWRKVFSERWSGSAIVAPMVRSDFETDADGLRIFGLGLLSWYWIPDELKLSFGAVYLDRNDISLLPALGLEWTPTPWWKLELMFPRPRLAYRLAKEGASSEWWGYLGGALGGNTWAVQRSDGSSDELSLRDYRLVLGIERLVAGGGGWFAETGWVFGRQLEYESVPGEWEFADTWMIRAGMAY